MIEDTENAGDQIRDVSDIAYQIEQSAAGMVVAASAAVTDGDSHGAARRLAIAAREYEWAARIWTALRQIARARHCAELAAKVMAGEMYEPKCTRCGRVECLRLAWQCSVGR